MTLAIEWRNYDVVVIGSGGSGSQAAYAAAEKGSRVLVVSKDPLGTSDTKISEGIATVRETGADDDTEKTLSENIKMAGADLSLKSITDAFAKDSKSAYDRYRVNGLRPPINKKKNRPQSLPLPMGGHNKNRSVGHRNSGIAFGHSNWYAIVKEKNIDYIEDSWFLDIVIQKDKSNDGQFKKNVVGGIIYDASRGTLVAVRSPTVIIAAGGLSTLFFPKTDTMRGNTGDSYALAARVGADLVDMEQIQFLPFCLASPPSYEGLLAGEPVTASFLGVLRDKNGKILLDSVYLRTRAQCSSAIMRAVADGRGSPNGGAYLDMTANKRAPRSGPYFMRFLESILPSAYNNVRQAMSKLAGKAEEPWEVRQSAHYAMGGIRVNENGVSVGGEKEGEISKGISGLFAAGQAMGGLFGANRLGSTSLTELAVFGNRAGIAASKLARSSNLDIKDESFTLLIKEIKKLFGQKGNISATSLKVKLQKNCWDNIGPVRTKVGLDRIEKLLHEIKNQLSDIYIPSYGVWNQAFLDFVELRNMLDTAKTVSMAAMERNGSLGGHVRLDCKNISILSQPYSTLINKDNSNKWLIKRVKRDRTPFKSLISYKIIEYKRLFQAKILALTPSTMRDRKLEKIYKKIMGNTGKAPEVMPGAAEGAIGESTQV